MSLTAIRFAASLRRSMFNVMVALTAILLLDGHARAQGLAAGALDTTFGGPQTFNQLNA